MSGSDTATTSLGLLGERAQACADLHHAIARAHLGQARDASDGVGVGHEVLPQIAPRREAVL